MRHELILFLRLLTIYLTSKCDQNLITLDIKFYSKYMLLVEFKKKTKYISGVYLIFLNKIFRMKKQRKITRF